MNFSELRSCLLDLSQPLPKRTHAAFHLRTLGSSEAVGAIAEALLQRKDSELMRHELAYILGQMQNEQACPVLTKIVQDVDDDILVRHEAAEALGAIGKLESKEVLEAFLDDPAPEVRDTCRLSVDLITWRNSSSTSSSSSSSEFKSVDPAPAADDANISVDELTKTLLDESQGLFIRYRAMFALRNRNTDECALALVKALADGSALVRHEIAYVLGQMQRACAVPGLAKVLQDASEHRMVRHEAAEALGAIGTPEAEEILKPYAHDEEQVVRESCDVALDTMEYWNKDFPDAMATSQAAVSST